jgi:hypothetical protein
MKYYRGIEYQPTTRCLVSIHRFTELPPHYLVKNENGGAGWVRTSDLRFFKSVLYQVEVAFLDQEDSPETEE